MLSKWGGNNQPFWQKSGCPGDPKSSQDGEIGQTAENRLGNTSGRMPGQLTTGEIDTDKEKFCEKGGRQDKQKKRWNGWSGGRGSGGGRSGGSVDADDGGGGGGSGRERDAFDKRAVMIKTILEVKQEEEGENMPGHKWTKKKKRAMFDPLATGYFAQQRFVTRSRSWHRLRWGRTRRMVLLFLSLSPSLTKTGIKLQVV